MSSRKRERQKKSDKEQPQVMSDELSEKERQRLFERELVWCVEQLEVGISNSKKPDSKQSQEAMKLLKVLRNPTAPLIKKRQVMRNAFGDYRKKMEQEEKKYRMTAKSISLKVGQRENRQKAQFLRKSTHNPVKTSMHSKDQKSARPDIAADNCHSCTFSQPEPNCEFKWTSTAQSGENTFKFGFSVNDRESAENLDINMEEMVEDTGKQLDEMNLNLKASQLNEVEQTNSDGLANDDDTVSANYYKLPTSTNSFRFNFQVP